MVPSVLENVPPIVNVPLLAIVNPCPPGPEIFTFDAESVPCTTAADVVTDVDVRAVTTAFVALNVVISARESVVVPAETVKLLEKMPLPTTSRATNGVFPIPKNPEDISPCRNGLEETVE